MLNRLKEVILLFLSVIIQNIYGQPDEIKILSLEDALQLSALNFPQSTPEFYKKEIKCTYYNWIYNINKLRILTEKKELYNNLIKTTDLKFKAGDINIAEKALIESEYLKIELNCVTARNDLLISESALKRILSIEHDILPGNDSMVRYKLSSGIADTSHDDTLNINDFKSYVLHKEFINLKIKLKMYDEQLIFYKKVLAYTQETVAAIKSRFENEDIEYTDYVKVINGALDVDLSYLTTLNFYNQTALEIESYFNKF
jgi:hypothetical protein